jgi:cytoskeletal protein RodZ
MKSLREQKKRKNFLNKKAIIIASISVAILLLVGGGWFFWQSRNASIPVTPTVAENEAAVKTETQPQSEVAPADNNENSESAKNGESTTTPTTPSGKKQVTPSLTFVGYADGAKQQVEVDAFVQGVLEDGGTCVMTATKGGQKVTAQSTGRANVSQTRCENIIVDRSKFPSGGTWSVVVTYESATASGSSAPQNMEL